MKTLDEMSILFLPWVAKETDEHGSYDVYENLGEMLYPKNLDEDLATAKLISAAPELYEALREICETVEGENVHFTGASAWLAKARAALEKAGGAE